MKRLFLLIAAAVLALTSGCSFKVDRDTFFLPQDEVESVEIQREYQKEDQKGTYFVHKVVTEKADMERICSMIRELPVRRISTMTPQPITEFSMIIIIGGKREHHLILNEEIAFYDQVPYEYEKKGTYQKFVDLYDALGYQEEETEPNRF